MYFIFAFLTFLVNDLNCVYFDFSARGSFQINFVGFSVIVRQKHNIDGRVQYCPKCLI